MEETAAFSDCLVREQRLKVQEPVNFYNMGVALKSDDALYLVSASAAERGGNGFQVMQVSPIGGEEEGKVERREWVEGQEKDPNNLHFDRSVYMKSVVVNSRLYVFTNLNPSNPSPVVIIDFDLRRIFPVLSKKHVPSTPRINYSLSYWKHKVYLYGGLDNSNKILETMDEFDCSIYKFQQVKYRLDYKPPGRQAHAAITIDQYNMFIIGGTFQESMIDPQPVPADEMILNFDPDACTFQKVSIKASGPTDPIPSNLVFHSVFRLDKSRIGILWYDWEIKGNDQALTNRIMRSTIYDIVDHTWKDVTLIAANLVTFRFGHSLLPLYNEHRVAEKIIIVGGIDVSRPVENNKDLSLVTLDFRAVHEFKKASAYKTVKEQKKLQLPVQC